MPATHYLIVGGGMTAAAAIRGIRDVDQAGTITLVSAEPDPPYKRPPLSKGLWAGTPLDHIWTKTTKYGVDIHLGRTAHRIDCAAKEVVDTQGQRYRYDKLLLATGSRPRRLPINDDAGVIYFRTLQDYRRLRALSDRGQQFAVIGGGFIGSEIAAALAANGKQVTLIFPGQAIGDRIFPNDLAHSLNELYRAKGVEVLAQETVIGLERRGEQSILRVRRDDATEHELTVDGVVAGVGTRPNIELALSGGLATDDGILVDRSLRTSDPDVFAAGDVANVWMPTLGERRRVEHEDNAKTMGRLAGRAMAGQAEPYDHLPFFYSDLFDLGYEAVGDLDSRLRTVAHWTEPFRQGVVYYLRDDRIRGVLLWNVWDQVDAARAVIGQPQSAHVDRLQEPVLVSG
jgi:3-phenylpropionate/trans-cinnamate dioxygenase ferredoxin reductase component